MEKILVLDFGGQYDLLIARRVREQHVYAEIKAYSKITPEEIRASGYRGVIFTGGPNSVYDPASPHFDPAILGLGVPILGICYGHQLLAWMAGGVIASADSGSEYGKVTLRHADSPLFAGIPEESVCWMSHTDSVTALPPGFSALAATEHCPVAAMADEGRRLYGVQFHPEVTHTVYGKQLLHNFLFAVCGCAGDWTMDDFVSAAVAKYRRELAGKGSSARSPAGWIPRWRRCCCTGRSGTACAASSSITACFGRTRATWSSASSVSTST